MRGLWVATRMPLADAPARAYARLVLQPAFEPSQPGIDRRLEAVLWVVVVLQSLMAVGFVFEISPAVDIWPFAGRGPLTNIFIGSIFAAAAASTGWCLLARSRRALAGIALDYITIFLPFGVYSLVRATDDALSGGRLIAFAAVSLAGAVVGVALLRWSLQSRWRDPRPTPPLVRWSFMVFIVALLIVSGMLLARTEVLPWPVTGDLATLIGFMFLGAAAYFVFALADPCWENAGGQLAGFLAYDLVLIVPFAKRLPDVSPDFRVNLIVYTAVLVYSGMVALYYLMVYRPVALLTADVTPATSNVGNG